MLFVLKPEIFNLKFSINYPQQNAHGRNISKKLKNGEAFRRQTSPQILWFILRVDYYDIRILVTTSKILKIIHAI